MLNEKKGVRVITILGDAPVEARTIGLLGELNTQNPR